MNSEAMTSRYQEMRFKWIQNTESEDRLQDDLRKTKEKRQLALDEIEGLKEDGRTKTNAVVWLTDVVKSHCEGSSELLTEFNTKFGKKIADTIVEIKRKNS